MTDPALTVGDEADPIDFETALNDEAAEGDDSVPADAAGAERYAAYEPDYSGVCRGGPYDGRTVASRFPGGFLLYDKPNRLAWNYHSDPTRSGDFVCVGSPASVHDSDALRDSAEGLQLDVIAFDSERPVL